MRASRWGNWAILGLVGVNLLLWLAFPPPNDGREAFQTQFIGEMFSTSALILISCGIFLTLRPRFLEPFFGGLDRMYRTHRLVMIAAICALLGHFLVVSYGRGINLGASIGKIALIGLLVEFVLALAPRIPSINGYLRLPYGRWKLIHRFTGLFLIIGVLHTYRVDILMQHSPPINLFVRAISFSGIAAYLFRELLQPLLQRGHAYVVEDARRINGTVLEVTLRPQNGKLAHRAGQFLFVRFGGDKALGEQHPFTISSAPDSAHLKLAVRASGDFTQHMFDHLAPGAPARVEGGYGRFDYKAGGPRQIWIAGGIGVTPFLSWMRDFAGQLDREVDFFYSVRSENDALYEDEIRQVQAENPTFCAHVYYTTRDGHLTVDRILEASGGVAGREIYLCGPWPMTEALTGRFRQLGVPAEKIHYEEFNFR